MALLNHVTREVTAKIVYYGPGLCGKTTNLKYLYDNLDEEHRTNMLSFSTETDRTLFFDFLPLELGTLRGFKVRIQLYTVPGQVFYEETRKRVLKGCDGVVFVADSQRDLADANRESFSQLKLHLAANGLVFEEMPLVLQYNKRDLLDILSVDDLDRELNPGSVPFVEAIAPEGIGVEDTMRAIIRLVVKGLMQKGLGIGGEEITSSFPAPMARGNTTAATERMPSEAFSREPASDLLLDAGTDPFIDLSAFPRFSGAEGLLDGPLTVEPDPPAAPAKGPSWLFEEEEANPFEALQAFTKLQGAKPSAVVRPEPPMEPIDLDAISEAPALRIKPGEPLIATLEIEGKRYRLTMRIDPLGEDR